MLEERVAMYLQAIEYATAANDNARREALEKDIQVTWCLYMYLYMYIYIYYKINIYTKIR